VDVRIDYKVFIQFHIDENEKWIAIRHESEHNHPLHGSSM